MNGDVKWVQDSALMMATIDDGTVQLPRVGREHYLGMSAIGGCAAEQWHQYHNADTHGAGIEPSLQRIFDLGHVIEDLVVGYMKAGGASILSTQAEYIDFDGRLRGHSDLVLGTEDGKKIVTDVKSMNQRNFDWLKKAGFKTSHWKYYCQLTMYAGYEGADAIQIIAYGKDTSEIIVQTMEFDAGCFEMLKSRAMMILDAPTKPPCEKGNGRVKWCGCRRA